MERRACHVKGKEQATDEYGALAEAVAAARPLAAVVLGSGMAAVARRLSKVASASYGQVPGLETPTVPGHAGVLSLADWGTPVLLFEGRLHCYEGHDWNVVTAPVRVAASLGVRMMLLTNAAGGIHDALVPGSLMAVRDHIEWTRPCCWRNAERPSPYAPRLLELLRLAARHENTAWHPGVYAAVTGPCYETPAEIRALRAWGADAVGMSTAREALAAAAAGLECAAVSLITNRAAGLGPGPIQHQEVLAAGLAGADRLAALVGRFLTMLP